jgi:Zn ribbon nucleic-acid-binding protein
MCGDAVMGHVCLRCKSSDTLTLFVSCQVLCFECGAKVSLEEIQNAEVAQETERQGTGFKVVYGSVDDAFDAVMGRR